VVTKEAQGGMDSIKAYYGPYRGKEVAFVVAVWLDQRKLSQSELKQLYHKTIRDISGEYRNVPD
jgi:hypothetical protein